MDIILQKISLRGTSLESSNESLQLSDLLARVFFFFYLTPKCHYILSVRYFYLVFSIVFTMVTVKEITTHPPIFSGMNRALQNRYRMHPSNLHLCMQRLCGNGSGSGMN